MLSKGWLNEYYNYYLNIIWYRVFISLTFLGYGMGWWHQKNKDTVKIEGNNNDKISP